jgi:hypothetical protein
VTKHEVAFSIATLHFVTIFCSHTAAKFCHPTPRAGHRSAPYSILAGPGKQKTTEMYTHVTTNEFDLIISPINHLDL